MREPPSAVGRFGSVAAADVVVPQLQSFAVVAWSPLAASGRLFVAPPLAVGELPLPAERPGNDAPQQPRAKLRFPAASWVFRQSWRRPWPFAPCAMSRPSGDCAAVVAVAQPSAEGRPLPWVPVSARVLPVGAFRRQPTPPVAYAVAAAVARSWQPGDGLDADRSDETRKPPRDRPVSVPSEAEQGVAAVDVVAVVDVVVAAAGAVVADTIPVPDALLQS